jgi:hypothetical protein
VDIERITLAISGWQSGKFGYECLQVQPLKEV